MNLRGQQSSIVDASRRLAVAATATAALVATMAAAAAQRRAEPVPAALRARFGFSGPLMHKAGWGVRLLRIARLDGADKPAAIVVANPRRSRLEVLRCRDGSLEVEHLQTDGALAGLATGDVDGDGVIDLLTLTARGRLVVWGGADPSRTTAAIDVGDPADGDALRAADLDSDGRCDALVRTATGFRRVTHIAAAPRVAPADPMLGRKLRDVHLLDADGDTRPDVVVAVNDDTHGLWIQRTIEDGTGGPWLAMPVAAMTNAFPGTHRDGPTLATIEGRHGRVVESRLRRVDGTVRPGLELLPLPTDTSRGARAFAHGDLDGDGDADLVIADAERAQLRTYLFGEDGVSVHTTPSLAGIDSLSITDLDGDGAADLLLTSAEEGALAWKSGTAPADAFPARLPVEDKPLVAVATGGDVLYLAQKDRKVALWRMRQPTAQPGNQRVLDLGRMPDAPLRLMAADLDGDGHTDLAFVQPKKGLRVLRGKANGDFHMPKGGDRGPAMLEVADGAVELIEHAGRPALLVVQPRFTRVLRLDANGDAEVLAQDNGPEGAERLDLATELPAGGRAYADLAAGKIWLARPENAPVSVDIPQLGITHLLAQDDAVLLLAIAGILRVPLAGTAWELQRLRDHEPPTDDTSYYGGTTGDWDNDGVRELAVACDDLHGFHVLTTDGRRLARALSFPIFELTEGSDGNNEPHEFAAGDVDGDGADDLVVLCHDRALVYLQARATPEEPRQTGR